MNGVKVLLNSLDTNLFNSLIYLTLFCYNLKKKDQHPCILGLADKL